MTLLLLIAALDITVVIALIAYLVHGTRREARQALEDARRELAAMEKAAADATPIYDQIAADLDFIAWERQVQP